MNDLFFGLNKKTNQVTILTRINNVLMKQVKPFDLGQWCVEDFIPVQNENEWRIGKIPLSANVIKRFYLHFIATNYTGENFVDPVNNQFLLSKSFSSSFERYKRKQQKKNRKFHEYF